jgi:hypothetical protein
MTRRISSSFAVVFLTCLLSIVSHAQAAGPKAAAAAFYKFDRANSQTFNRRNIDARKRWFSDELYRLFVRELAREKAYIAENPSNKPYFGNVIPFQPLDEVCELNRKKYRRVVSFGKETIKGDIGNVDVYFKYPKGCNLPDILYSLNMEKQRGRWVISDVRYIGENTSLVEDLNRSEY